MSDRPLHHSNPSRGFLYALVSIILLSSGFVAGKYALGEFNPETLSLVWATAGAAYALLFLLGRGSAHELLIPRRLVAPVLGLGLVAGSALMLTWAGLRLLDPTFAAFLWRFHPVVSIILSFLLLGERLTAWELPPVAVMLVGVVTCTSGQWTIVGKGVILVSVAVMFGAAQGLIAKVLAPDIHPRVLVFYRNALAAIGIAAWIVPTGRLDLSEVHLETWIVVLGGAALGPFTGIMLFFASLRYWELSRSSVVQITQPLFVLPMAVVFLHQVPKPLELMGGIFILAGAFWLTALHVNRTRSAARSRSVRFYVLKSENFALTLNCPAFRGWLRGCVQGMGRARGGRRR